MKSPPNAAVEFIEIPGRVRRIYEYRSIGMPNLSRRAGGSSGSTRVSGHPLVPYNSLSVPKPTSPPVARNLSPPKPALSETFHRNAPTWRL